MDDEGITDTHGEAEVEDDFEEKKRSSNYEPVDDSQNFLGQLTGLIVFMEEISSVNSNSQKRPKVVVAVVVVIVLLLRLYKVSIFFSFFLVRHVNARRLGKIQIGNPHYS